MLEDDEIFESGRVVKLSTRGGEEHEAEIEFFRRQHGRCVVKFRGIDSISEVEKYIGSEVRITEDTLPEVEEGSFYTFELKGCSVFAAGEYVGTVADVMDAGGTEILKVERKNVETLIPFAQEYLKNIDLDRRRIDVDLPEDLRDLNK